MIPAILRRPGQDRPLCFLYLNAFTFACTRISVRLPPLTRMHRAISLLRRSRVPVKGDTLQLKLLLIFKPCSSFYLKAISKRHTNPTYCTYCRHIDSDKKKPRTQSTKLIQVPKQGENLLGRGSTTNCFRLKEESV